MGTDIRIVAVVGTGSLGTMIAIQAAHFGYGVVVFDADPDSFFRAHHTIGARLKTSEKKGRLTFDQWEAAAKKVQSFNNLEGAVKDADLVIEAVSEKMDVKRQVFENIDKFAPQGAILATNSSSIPISRIESAVTKPEQCLNIHFYGPSFGTNMVDVMGGTKTKPEVLEASKKWVRSIGCVPITINKEIMGFCFNRIWRTAKREILYMWAGGFVDFRDVDRSWMIFTGMPKGPFGMMDEVGLDVTYDIEMVYFNESKEQKDYPPEALKAKVAKKELGVKTGKGFYSYPDPEYARPDFLKG